uniref:Uncharacterized protein n=1 Tax=Nelumbo nucifera TaxID=4432 RepID=A0A822YQW4_NELNU|nr:TPA_asm: hypothetical protein HUJ06_007225 [Nelumbo nucifera]
MTLRCYNLEGDRPAHGEASLLMISGRQLMRRLHCLELGGQWEASRCVAPARTLFQQSSVCRRVKFKLMSLASTKLAKSLLVEDS